LRSVGLFILVASFGASASFGPSLIVPHLRAPSSPPELAHRTAAA
jgi:hypothetical protein